MKRPRTIVTRVWLSLSSAPTCPEGLSIRHPVVWPGETSGDHSDTQVNLVCISKLLHFNSIGFCKGRHLLVVSSALRVFLEIKSNKYNFHIFWICILNVFDLTFSQQTLHSLFLPRLRTELVGTSLRAGLWARSITSWETTTITWVTKLDTEITIQDSLTTEEGSNPDFLKFEIVKVVM